MIVLRYRKSNEASNRVGHWKRIRLQGGVVIDGRGFFHAESVPGFDAPLLVLVCERFLGVPADTLPMPEFLGKIHSFFVPVHISGSTYEQDIEARKRPIQ